MAKEFILVGPKHCSAVRKFISEKYEALGVKNASNIVGRIANMHNRYQHIQRHYDDWEANRQDACQNIAYSVLEQHNFDKSDRVLLISELKRARARRDEWHYKVNLFQNLEQMMRQLPELYITTEEYVAARSQRVADTLERHKRLAIRRRQKRAHLCAPRRAKPLA